MIKITRYTNEKKGVLIRFLEELQDHIIEVDPLKRFVRLPDYGKRYAEELIEQVGKQNGIIYFAEDKHTPVGVIVGIVEELTENDLQECVPSKLGTILQLIISNKYRGRNIGTLLLNSAEEYFQNQGCDVIYVGVLEPNTRARDFYQKKGFQNRIITLMKKI